MFTKALILWLKDCQPDFKMLWDLVKSAIVSQIPVYYQVKLYFIYSIVHE